MMTNLTLQLPRSFYYAGIGTRKLNKASSHVFMRYACAMAFMGGKVRSGHADGSDMSFEIGAKIAYDKMAELLKLEPGKYSSVMEIHLPWSGFNGQEKNDFAGYHYTNHPAAVAMAERFHPAWEHLGRGPRSMMSRNCNQVMGLDMATPIRFVICETPDGAYDSTMTSSKTGGTGQAIRVADAHGIKVYNFKNPEHKAKILAWLDEVDLKLKALVGLTTSEMVDEYLQKNHGLPHRVEGDLVQLANRGEVDVMIHGVNCQGKMNSGIAKSVRETFPEAYTSYMKHKAGTRSLLGQLDIVDVERAGKSVKIINAFTQFNYGRDADVLYADYEAIRKAFKAIATQFDRKCKIGVPRIGAGLANGCWMTISNIIHQELKHHNVVLVDYPLDNLSLTNEHAEPEIKAEPAQIGLF